MCVAAPPRQGSIVFARLRRAPKSHPDHTDSVPGLRRARDQFNVTIAFTNLVPEPGHLSSPTSWVWVDVVQRDDAPRTHEFDVVREVTCDAVVRVIAVEKEKVDGLAVQSLSCLLPHGRIVRVASQCVNTLPLRTDSLDRAALRTLRRIVGFPRRPIDADERGIGRG